MNSTSLDIRDEVMRGFEVERMKLQSLKEFKR